MNYGTGAVDYGNPQAHLETHYKYRLSKYENAKVDNFIALINTNEKATMHTI